MLVAGAVVWVYCAEIFPLKYRSKAAGLTTAANWVGNTVIGFFPPLLFSHIGLDTFWIFALFCLACFATACWLPETRGQSLEEATTMLASRAVRSLPRSSAPPGLAPATPADPLKNL